MKTKPLPRYSLYMDWSGQGDFSIVMSHGRKKRLISLAINSAARDKIVYVWDRVEQKKVWTNQPEELKNA